MSLEQCIANLNQSIQNQENETKIKGFMDILSNSIEEVVEIQDFYSLPMNNILDVAKESNFESVETITKLVERLSDFKPEEAALILNVVDTEYGDLEDYISVISSLKCCPLCHKIWEINKRSENLPCRDYKSENENLLQEIAKIKAENKSLKNQISESCYEEEEFHSVRSKPYNFEPDIFKAARNGNLESLQYLVEVKSENPNKVDRNGMTPLRFAAWKGNTNIVKYLIKMCGVNPSANDTRESPVIILAAESGNLELFKYLVEKRGVDPNTNAKGSSPIRAATIDNNIEIMNYLIEKCGVSPYIRRRNEYKYSHESNINLNVANQLLSGIGQIF